jgi:hypothetical protein
MARTTDVPSTLLGVSKVRIGFPVKCRYRGGNPSLGARGGQLRITDDRIGHGWFLLSRALPIEIVDRVVVTERTIEAAEARPLLAQGMQGRSSRGSPRGASKVFTDISVHTTDGRTALWVVERRDAEWVRKKLAPVLEERQIPLD